MSNQPRNKPLILIFPGHGGVDTGAIARDSRGREVYESRLNLTYCRRLAIGLNVSGVDVMLMRQSDATLTINERVAISNILRPDLIISWHNNSHSSEAHGIEVFTSPGQTMSDIAAGHVINRIQSKFPNSKFRQDFSDGDPDKEAEYQILTDTLDPAILIEGGFMSNKEELIWLQNHLTILGMCDAVTAATLDFLGVRI